MCFQRRNRIEVCACDDCLDISQVKVEFTVEQDLLELSSRPRRHIRGSRLGGWNPALAARFHRNSAACAR